jgi:hypothetical protein
MHGFHRSDNLEACLDQIDDSAERAEFIEQAFALLCSNTQKTTQDVTKSPEEVTDYAEWSDSRLQQRLEEVQKNSSIHGSGERKSQTEREMNHISFELGLRHRAKSTAD